MKFEENFIFIDIPEGDETDTVRVKVIPIDGGEPTVCILLFSFAQRLLHHNQKYLFTNLSFTFSVLQF